MPSDGARVAVIGLAVVDPGDVFLAALASNIRHTELQDDKINASCAAASTQKNNEEVLSFTITGTAKPFVWKFSREQNRYKLTDAGLGPSKTSRFFPTTPKGGSGKKWTPKLR